MSGGICDRSITAQGKVYKLIVGSDVMYCLEIVALTKGQEAEREMGRTGMTPLDCLLLFDNPQYAEVRTALKWLLEGLVAPSADIVLYHRLTAYFSQKFTKSSLFKNIS